MVGRLTSASWRVIANVCVATMAFTLLIVLVFVRRLLWIDAAIAVAFATCALLMGVQVWRRGLFKRLSAAEWGRVLFSAACAGMFLNTAQVFARGSTIWKFDSMIVPALLLASTVLTASDIISLRKLNLLKKK